MERLEKIWKWLNVKQEERELVFLLIAYSFFMGGATAIFYTVVASSFLISFDRSALPNVYIVGGIFLYGLGMSVGRLQKVVPYDRLAEYMLGFLVVTILLMLGVYHFTGNIWVFFVLFIWNRVFVLVNGVTFWAVVAKLFNMQQSKRLSGLINSGDVISSVIAYLAIPIAIHLIGTEALLVVTVCFLMVCGGIIRRIHNRYMIKGDDEEVVVKEAKPIRPDQELNPSYYRNIFLLALLPVFALFYVEYIFFTESRVIFPDKQLLASFLGLFFGICAIFELLIKTFLYNYIVRKYGLTAGILILPVSLLFGFGIAVMYGMAYDTAAIFFACIALSRFFMSAIRKAISDPVYQVLYQPIHSSFRLQIQGRIEGRAKSIGGLVAGVILMIFTYWIKLDVLWLSIIFLFTALIWTIIAFNGQVSYRQVIRDKVFPDKKNKPITSGITKYLPSVKTYDELIVLAASASDSDRLEAATGLGTSLRFLSFRYLIPLMQDPKPQVREAAIYAAGELKRPELWPYLFEQLDFDRYSSAAANALGKSGTPVIKQIEKFFLSGTESKLRQIRLLSIVEGIGGDEAIRFLRRNMFNPNRFIREKVVDILRNLGYMCTLSEQTYLVQDLDDHLRTYAWLLAAQDDLSVDYDYDSQLIINIERERRRILLKAFSILEVVFSPKFKVITLLNDDEEEDVRDYLIEICGLLLPEDIKNKLLPILESDNPGEMLESFQEIFPQDQLSVEERLKDVVNKDYTRISRWTKSVAIKELKRFDPASITPILVANAVSSSKVISETSFYVLRIVNYERFSSLYKVIDNQKDIFHKKIMEPLDWLSSEEDLLICKLRRLRAMPQLKDLSSEDLQRILLNSKYFKVEQDDVIDLRKSCSGENVSLLVTYGELAFSKNKDVSSGQIWNVTEHIAQGVVMIPNVMSDTEFYILESYILNDLAIETPGKELVLSQQ